MASKRKKTESRADPLPVAVTYPWHKDLWQQLTAGRPGLDHLSHAMLLHGQRGLGKSGFVMRLAHSLLCQSAGAEAAACGHCKSCHLLAAGNHPDLVFVRPAEEGKAITVDQIRELADYLYLKPHIAGRKVIIIQPADSMNIHAANSLLKMLEEPPLGNMLLLVSDRPARLPVTIRSRCQSVSFSTPELATGLGWLTSQGIDVDLAEKALAYAAGSPILALTLSHTDFLEHHLAWMRDLSTLFSTNKGDISEVAAKWKKAGSGTVLLWLHGLVQDLVRRACGLQPSLPAMDEKADQWLQDAIKQLNLSELFDFLDHVSEVRVMLDTPLDEQLMLEDLLIKWIRLAARNK